MLLCQILFRSICFDLLVISGNYWTMKRKFINKFDVQTLSTRQVINYEIHINVLNLHSE